MFKKVLSILVVLVLCCTTLVGAVSAENKTGIAKPSNTLVTNGNGGKTDVGTWFMTYLNQGWGSNFGSGYPIKFRTLMPDGSYGILDSSKVEHIDFQLKQIADAKIDFIIYDITNGGVSDKFGMGWSGLDDNGLPTKNSIVKNAILTSQRIAEWNKNNDWKIRYCLAVGVYNQLTNGAPVGVATEYQAEGVYKYFYEQDFGGDNYYHVDGKPMLIIFDWAYPAIEDWDTYGGERTYGDKFFVRGAQEGNVGTYGWHTEEGSAPHEEVIVVCPGHDTAGEGGRDTPRANGSYYKRGWETILTNMLPRIIVVTSFNDYNEQTAVWVADTSKCNPEIEEHWIDAKGNHNPAMYWNMTKEGIRLVRTFNGDVQGEFKSNIFNLGQDAVTKGTTSNNTMLIIIIIATAVVVIAGALVCVLLLTKKKTKK